jgi:hypothetical protein
VRASAALLVGLALSGCAMNANLPAASAGCDAAKASGFVGRKADEALVEQARQAAGAERARVLAPGTMVTMEYLAGRLNLDVDAGGIVQGVRCG